MAFKDKRTEDAYSRLKIWRAIHPEERRAQGKRYRERYKEKIKVEQKARRAADPGYIKNYRAKNREHCLGLMREYYRTHLDRFRDRNKKWAKANPDANRACKVRHKARKRNAEGSHTAADIAWIRKAQRNRCAACSSPLGRKGHVDHIVALSRGGSNWPRNLQWLCASCNCSKHNRDALEFARSRGLLL